MPKHVPLRINTFYNFIQCNLNELFIILGVFIISSRLDCEINIGDIWTTNTIAAEPGSLKVGDMLTPGADGYLAPGEGADALHPTMQVVKVYTMPDMQPGVKVMRVK